MQEETLRQLVEQSADFERPTVTIGSVEEIDFPPDDFKKFDDPR